MRFAASTQLRLGDGIHQVFRVDGLETTRNRPPRGGDRRADEEAAKRRLRTPKAVPSGEASPGSQWKKWKEREGIDFPYGIHVPS